MLVIAEGKKHLVLDKNVVVAQQLYNRLTE